jgi:putative GTP pyrophosphokinase
MSSLRQQYESRFEAALVPIASGIERQLRELFAGASRIDRVTARAKSVTSFLTKATTIIDGRRKYKDPLSEIQDQIGARIVTFYVSDVPRVDAIVRRYYTPIEIKSHVPENEWEFGYFGQHYVLPVPTDFGSRDMEQSLVPSFFELQIKTLFQHAWSEAGHDLGYKPSVEPLTSDQKRRLAFTSAQAWGADQIFDALFQEKASPSP